MSVPWYKDYTAPHPFVLSKTITSDDQDAAAFRAISFFPWTTASLRTLWNGNVYSPDMETAWKQMISEYHDAVAVASARSVVVFFICRNRPPISIMIPSENKSDLRALPTDHIRVAWALKPNAPLEPLLIFSDLNWLYVYNIERKGTASYLRGHGGAITSIAVHPTMVNLFCTTSRDHSTRIYDLTLEVKNNLLLNPPWPPGSSYSEAGPAHGLHMTEGEGSGDGRCIIILLGGQSGGHQAAVLGAAFHPQLPLIATCGLDREVKIWFVPKASDCTLTREDKPLFSSGRIHKARVLHVAWLHHDLILTHGAPALMRKYVDQSELKETFTEPGTLAVWQWLGINRFFPPSRGEDMQDVLRGCASDYHESASFKIISSVTLTKVAQHVTPDMHIYQSRVHDPVVLLVYPSSTRIFLFNVTHLQPRKPPLFPFDIAELTEPAERLRLTDDDDVLPNEAQTTNRSIVEGVLRWYIAIPQTSSSNEKPEGLMACAMGMGGKVVIGVGSKGGVWIWQQKQVMGLPMS